MHSVRADALRQAGFGLHFILGQSRPTSARRSTQTLGLTNTARWKLPKKLDFEFLLSFHALARHQKRTVCRLSGCYAASQQTSSCKAHVTSTLGASVIGLERKPTVGVLKSFEFSQLGRCKSLNPICCPKCCIAIAGAAATFKRSGRVSQVPPREA